jgi:uncharacterized protein YbjQ (UPF0145 family)
MGLASSRHTESGSLPGAYAPPLSGVTLPKPLHSAKKFLVTVPHGKQGGDRMVVAVHGKHMSIKIPTMNVITADRYQAGEKFYYTQAAEVEKVIASTLPTVPGMEIVESKPIIWGTVSYSFFASNYNDQKEQTRMAKETGEVLKKAQEELLEQTVEVGCNAVLGMTFNITIDSSGEHGNSKIIIATAYGTPCVIMPMRTLPTVDAHAVVIPLYASAPNEESEK